jgi:predicted nucleic acid-binding protein
MIKKDVFIDSDVLLDVALKRRPHYEDAQKILALIESNRIGGYTSALIVANCYYIISNLKDKVVADKAVKKIRSILHVLPLTDRELGESLHSNFADFEDGVQYFIALNNGIGTIITRNTGDYKKASIAVLAPAEFLRLEPVAAMFGKVM